MASGLDTFAISPSASQTAEFFGRAAIALALGALIGIERQWRQRMAGLRTNALVALGSALFELFDVLLSGTPGTDPTRIAAYVVSGIGFLGAGVILRDGINVRGINTAATIWCSAAVGVLAGAGFVIEAAMAAGLVITTSPGRCTVVRSGSPDTSTSAPATSARRTRKSSSGSPVMGSSSSGGSSTMTASSRIASTNQCASLMLRYRRNFGRASTSDSSSSNNGDTTG